MSTKTMVSIFFASLVFLSFVPKTHAASCALVNSPNHLINITNNYRKVNGLCPLVENPKLNVTAYIKACDINNRKYWSHTTPEGEPFYQTMINNGAIFRYYGENIAANFTTDEEALNALIASPSHKANLLAPYNYIGIAKCGNITVQHFASN